MVLLPGGRHAAHIKPGGIGHTLTERIAETRLRLAREADVRAELQRVLSS